MILSSGQAFLVHFENDFLRNRGELFDPRHGKIDTTDFTIDLREPVYNIYQRKIRKR